MSVSLCVFVFFAVRHFTEDQTDLGNPSLMSDGEREAHVFFSSPKYPHTHNF